MMSKTSGILNAAACVAPILVKESNAPGDRRAGKSPAQTAQRIEFQLSTTVLSPTPILAWLLGALGVLACITTLVPGGRLWLVAIITAAAVIAAYDACALWITRNELALVLLPPEKGLRGREGQVMAIPLAIAGSERRARRHVRVALMATTQDSQIAMRVKSDPENLALGDFVSDQNEGAAASGMGTRLWPWNPDIALLRRGLWPGPRAGLERRSPCGIWNLRKWFDCPVPIRIDADLRPGRREMLRSPVYRALVASRETAWTGHGREFERLREYQPGDNYAEISWKSTARRGAPVTRLFQWEQKQEVYFVVDQSRASAQSIEPAAKPENHVLQARAPRRLLDVAVETALVGATVALELGDEFGLVTYAEEPKSWLPAGSGQFQLHQFRDHLLNIEPLPTTPDYEALFSNIRLRLRRRAYLVILADLTERSISDSMCRGIALLGPSHVVLMTSVLPAHAYPAFSPATEPRTNQEVYAALAGEKENQRLGALARQLRQSGTELRFVPPQTFLRTAVEGYVESKREQRI